MKRLALAVTAAFFALPAHAADVVYAEPPALMPEMPLGWSWTGMYAGVQAGYGFGSTGTLVLDPFTPALQTAFAPGFTGRFHDGFVGGVHIGYDWQFDNVVVGGVVDLSYADIGDSQTGFSTTPATYTISRSLDWLGTARLRAGYAFSDRVMAYATGGLAYGRVKFDYTQPGSGAAFTTSGGQSNNIGYMVGAGVETRVSPNFSIGLEYLYTDLGGNDFRANLVNGPFGAPGSAGTDLTGSDRRFDFHTIQVRFSYRF